MEKTRVLVVDDDPNLSDLVLIILERTQRFEVAVENRSAKALTTAHEFAPDLILLDIDMPGKDGGEVYRDMQADPHLRRVPTLFLTSLVSRNEPSERETLHGVMRFLPKPVNAVVLIETIDQILLATASAV